MIDNNSEQKILEVFTGLLDGIKTSAQSLTLEEVLTKSKPLTLELFSQNIHEYFYFITAQRVTKSFSTRLGTVIEKVSAVLVEAQGGYLVPGNPEPFDLKFIHPNGIEYWIEIKSINAQNSSNMQTIKERKKMTEGKNCQFYLCIYNDNTINSDKFKLNGHDFWELVGGSSSTWDNISSLVKGLGKNIKLQEIIELKSQELTKDYKDLFSV
ncbi:hypothetical protein VZH09_09680 [Synechococcus elongatus IITB7]|uniref:hypothetical protein n=1 Tax=Synechococcus elongatus TaxID=32046 RepID=UPI0030D1C5C8